MQVGPAGDVSYTLRSMRWSRQPRISATIVAGSCTCNIPYTGTWASMSCLIVAAPTSHWFRIR
eukprot:1459458-Pyramimonas_sp.AAC.1